MSRTSRRPRIEAAFESAIKFLTQHFASSVLSSRLCEKNKRSRQRARREKLKARRAVFILETRPKFLSLSRLFVLSFAFVLCSSSAGAQTLPSSASATPLRVIPADYLRVKGKHNEFFRQVVGAGRAAEVLRADWQRDLAFVHRQCGF